MAPAKAAAEAAFGPNPQYAVLGPDGSFEVDIDGRVTRTEFPKHDLERLELEAFAAAAAGAAPYPVPVGEVLHGVAVMQAAFQSAARDGARIQVEQTPEPTR